jgi:hypothetical protein
MKMAPSGIVNVARLDEGRDLTGDFDPASKFDLAAGRNNELFAPSGKST